MSTRIRFNTKLEPETLAELDEIAELFHIRGYAGMIKRGRWNRTRAIELAFKNLSKLARENAMLRAQLKETTT